MGDERKKKNSSGEKKISLNFTNFVCSFIVCILFDELPIYILSNSHALHTVVTTSN